MIQGAYWIIQRFLVHYQTLYFSNIAIALNRSLSLSFNFCISFVEWFMASFVYCFPYSYRSSNYCDSNSCRSFTLLKALAKSKSKHIAIAFKSNNFTFTIVGRAIPSQEARGKSPILLSQYWKNEEFDSALIILVKSNKPLY